MPSEQGRSGSVLPESDLGDLGETWRQLPYERMLHLFSGRPRLGSLAHAAEQLRVIVDQVDLMCGGLECNMALHESREAILAAVRANQYSIVWIGTPCSSFSLWWLDKSMRQLRSRERPMGVDGLPQRERAYLRKHNALVEFSAKVALAAYEAGITFIIENPPDRGRPSSHLFRWASRQHAPLWLAPCMQALAERTRPEWYTFPQCALGGDFQKWTSLMVAGPRASQLRGLGMLKCEHAKHRCVAEGRNSKGASNAAASGAYPLGMAAFVMWALARPSVRAGGCSPPICDIAELVGSSLEGVRQSIRVQEQLNAQAVAVFCGDAQCEACESSVDTAASPLQQVSWRSAADELPAQWDETNDVQGEQWALRSTEALRFISRRRAEPEAAEVLARRPMPKPHVQHHLPKVSPIELPDWPVGAPPRPIHISQLYNPGVYDDILQAVAEVADDMAEAELRLRCGAQSVTIPKRREKVWRAVDSQPEWARANAWLCTDVDDCVPLRSYTAEDPVTHSLDRSFFALWGKRLAWADEDMLQQMSVTGAEGRSDCSLDTVIMGHHGGLREHYQPARASVASDTARGWITKGTKHLVTVPSRIVPKNVVARKQWKLVLGELISVTKWRVTTDDSVESTAGDIRSRNAAMDRSTWGDIGLPSPQTLGEAIAIMRSLAAAMGIRASAVALERIALWALDLSDAYREIQVNRSEWWQQGFIWYDGVRLDMRCVFGAAHMPGLFQRVSTFVLAVAAYRIKQYDRQHPYSAARQAWSQWREENVEGDNGDCDFDGIYLDDGFGASILGPGEPLTGAADASKPVAVSTTVNPDGRVRLELFADKARGQTHLQIVQSTFNEAGWRVAISKVQHGLSLDLLGLGITTLGDGALFVPEVKRLGMIADIDVTIEPTATDGTVQREGFETLVGRSSHLGQVACEANVYLQPLYRMQNAKAKYVDRRLRKTVAFKPRRIKVKGSSPTQVRCREALEWFRAALQSGVSVPLAPRVAFPAVGDEGCAFCFTDAAREAGTGHGGFTAVRRGDQAEFLFLEQRWPADVLQALQENELSMVAGEAYGAVVLADAVLMELQSATHMVIFTDSSATEIAVNTGNSPSPQLNFLVRWLIERWPGVQFLGVWQKGIRNDVADRISRKDLAAVLDDVSHTLLSARRLCACEGAHDLMRKVWAEPQTAAS